MTKTKRRPEESSSGLVVDDEVRLIGIDEFCAIRGVERTRFYTLRNLGKIGPQPITQKGSYPKWRYAEVKAWMENLNSDGELYDSESWKHVWTKIKGRGK